MRFAHVELCLSIRMSARPSPRIRAPQGVGPPGPPKTVAPIYSGPAPQGLLTSPKGDFLRGSPLPGSPRGIHWQFRQEIAMANGRGLGRSIRPALNSLLPLRTRSEIAQILPHLRGGAPHFSSPQFPFPRIPPPHFANPATSPPYTLFTPGGYPDIPIVP
jgi:hypothetical protein